MSSPHLTAWVPAASRGVVLMLHGGAEHSRQPVHRGSAQVGRSRMMYDAIAPRLADAGLGTALLRFAVKGWNGDHGSAEPSPVADARWALARLRSTYDLPVVLLGHSMGGRTATWVADDPSVLGVVGLAPWFPADDPVEALAGRHVVGAHGSRDRITSARATRTFLDRAATVAASTRFLDRGPIGHYLLRDIRGWNRVALQESTHIFDVAGITSPS